MMQRKNILTGEHEFINPDKDPMISLGAQLVQRELDTLSLQTENESLGQQLVDIDLRLLQGGM